MKKVGSRVWQVGVAVACVIGLGAFLSPVQAQEPERDKRFNLYMSGFLGDADSKFAVSSAISGGVSQEVSFEDDLAVDDNVETFRAALQFRFGAKQRHALQLTYLDVARKGEVEQLQRDIEWGDVTFTAGVDLKVDIRTEDLDLHYTYYFIKRPKWDMGISAGVHTLRARTRLNARFRLGGLPIGDVEFESDISDIDEQVPLGLIGIHALYRVTPKLSLDAGFKFLSLEYDDYDGFYLDAWARLEYRVLRSLGIGGGIALIDVDVDIESSKVKPTLSLIDIEYHAAEFFLRWHFG